jgi:hypothetical protein
MEQEKDSITAAEMCEIVGCNWNHNVCTRCGNTR